MDTGMVKERQGIATNQDCILVRLVSLESRIRDIVFADRDSPPKAETTAKGIPENIFDRIIDSQLESIKLIDLIEEFLTT